ncbi:uncharacterized protein [Aquarana catesbeiana]|uniref:uncharacterized protein isoform X2 n=1 Tax=Aquarana catesbeiana TaxID=8400 RepID=UPI003CC99179
MEADTMTRSVENVYTEDTRRSVEEEMANQSIIEDDARNHIIVVMDKVEKGIWGEMEIPTRGGRKIKLKWIFEVGEEEDKKVSEEEDKKENGGERREEAKTPKEKEEEKWNKLSASFFTVPPVQEKNNDEETDSCWKGFSLNPTEWLNWLTGPVLKVLGKSACICGCFYAWRDMGKKTVENEEWLKMEEDEWLIKEQAGKVKINEMKESNIKRVEFQPCEVVDVKMEWEYEVAVEDEVRKNHMWHVKNIWEPAKLRKKKEKTGENQTEEEEEKDNSEEAEQREEQEKDNSEEAEQKEEPEKDNSEEAEQKEEPETDNSKENNQTDCQCNINPFAFLGYLIGPFWKFMKKHSCSCVCSGECKDDGKELYWYKLTREARWRRVRKAKERDMILFREELAKVARDRKNEEEERKREIRVTEEEKKRDERVRAKWLRAKCMPTEERRREIRMREEEKVREERVRAKRWREKMEREQKAKEDQEREKQNKEMKMK